MLPEHFDDLYQKHFREIYRHCYRIVRNKEDVEEFCSEAFIKAYFHRNQFDAEKGNFRNWLFAIATNLCFDFINSANQRKRQQTQSLKVLNFVASESNHPEEQSEQHQLLKFIEDCLAELSAEERIAVSLRHLQDFTL